MRFKNPKDLSFNIPREISLNYKSKSHILYGMKRTKYLDFSNRQELICRSAPYTSYVTMGKLFNLFCLFIYKMWVILVTQEGL